MAAPARSEPYRSGVLVAGKYRLAERLGVGAMGTVWSAVNVDTHGRVALKLIERPEAELRHRLLREARSCAAIRHRNVVQVFDVGQTDSGDPFLLMELLQGDTLAALLQRRRSLPQEEAVVLARDIARGLSAAHEQGIVHRDLKPANVFLEERPGEDAPVVKLLDFGVSKSLTTSDGLHTVVGGTIGSPVYMSPEQARGEPDVDFRADIWSFGVVLYEMLTGERPFSGESTDILFKITHASIPRVSHRLRRVDPALDRLVAACLNRDRAQRPASAAEIAAQLEAHVTAGAAVHRAAPRLERPAAQAPVAAPVPSVPSPSPPDGASDRDDEEDVPTVLVETGRPFAAPLVDVSCPVAASLELGAYQPPAAPAGVDSAGATAFAFGPDGSGASPADRASQSAPMDRSASAAVTATPCSRLPARAERRRRISPIVMVLAPVWVVLLGAIVAVSVFRSRRASEGAPAPAARPDASAPPAPSKPPPVPTPPAPPAAPPPVNEAPVNEAPPVNKTPPPGTTPPANKKSPGKPKPCPSKFGLGCPR